MTEKHNDSTTNRPEGTRTLDAAYVMADLYSSIQQITEEDAYSKNDRNAITLFKSNGVTLVLTALRSGAEMSTPEPSGNIVLLQVLKGKLDIEIDGKTSTVAQQQVLSFHAQNAYHITATEESVTLLTYCNH